MNTQTVTQESIYSWTPILPHQDMVAYAIIDAAYVGLVLERHRLDVDALAGQFVDCVNEILAIAS